MTASWRGPSSSDRPASSSGDPIRNRPAGIDANFIPIELVKNFPPSGGGLPPSGGGGGRNHHSAPTASSATRSAPSTSGQRRGRPGGTGQVSVVSRRSVSSGGASGVNSAVAALLSGGAATAGAIKSA